MSDRPDGRQSALDRIHAAYARYDASGHARRWSHTNAGEAFLSAQARARILDHLASVAHPDSRILDIGCGDGSLLLDARARGIDGTWVGVDVRSEAIEQAPKDDPRATFVVSSADALDVPDDHFDAVVASVLFSSLPTRDLEESVAREVARVLRPGGWLVWYDMRYPSPTNHAVHAVPARRVRKLFPGWRGRLEPMTLLPPLARRLGRATGRLYPALHRFPLLRSHLAGRLRKPATTGAPRLLLVTGLWPTDDMPSVGSFVRDRVRDAGPITVVGPRRYDVPLVLRYLRLLWDALTARGSFQGVEAHVLFPTGVIGLLVASMSRIPLVVYAHGDEVRNAVYRNRVYTWLGRLVVRRAAAVVANSADTAAHTRRLGRDDVEVVPVGIDLDRFRPSPRPAERRVLYIGGDRTEKGIDVARGLADTLAGAYLDEIDPADVPRLMSEHDVVLIPSVEEGFGLAAAEAIASGRWVVANAVGGLLEVITDGVNGTLVRDGDYASALAAVPDYDPQAVAVTARRFGIQAHRDGLRRIWERILAP